VLVVCGTRPEAIKLAPLVRHMRQSSPLQVMVCTTGQHREMLEPVLRFFDISPDIDLSLMTHGQELGTFAARALAELSRVLQDVQPAYVVVQGDTTTAFVAGLAAFYQHIPVGHVEAGLRTGDPCAPFPEEINRRLLSVVTADHFAPTSRARDALLREGVSPSVIQLTGNTIVDALEEGLRILDSSPAMVVEIGRQLAALAGGIDGRLILITGHRRESFGDGLRSVCQAIRTLAERYPRDTFVYPAHLNPEVQRPVREWLGGLPNLRVVPPADYPLMLALMRRAYIILTDSGGLQEEAPSLGVPVLVMRDKTERGEGVAAGVSRLVGTDQRTIVAAASCLLDDPAEHRRMQARSNPYGEGLASERIAAAIAARLGVAEKVASCS
jgi:UDP-N-acetylglucosamine 2-epimerase (non-hydrolysing)